jgi:hydroxyethylthiazole kinase-like uncharacterized protein yjeF
MARMQRVRFDRPWPLHDVAGSRAIEAAAAKDLPPHALMQRAGLAVARLALAIAPHARHVWVACGPGNNGGDGFETALHLHSWGKAVAVTFAGDDSKAPVDARASLKRARDAGVPFATSPPPSFDLAIDAMLGIGASRPLEGAMGKWAATITEAATHVLAVDLPSAGVIATHTLSLLTLKPSLFTGPGRDAAGEIWFDDLGIDASAQTPVALLSAPAKLKSRKHDSHKGSFGDVAVIGGARGMAGAALLAASAALHAGTGRVYVGMLDDPLPVDIAQPELMMRTWDSLDLAKMSVVCGCGGGDAVRGALPKVISSAKSLVLDADALNAIAADPQLQSLLAARGRRGRPTVITPHPLEAARMLGQATHDVQADRLRAALALAAKFGCVVALKGSGTVIAAPGEVPRINPTGNARLATGGTGDVLAGVIGAWLASGSDPFAAASGAAFHHGLVADLWPDSGALTASELALRMRPA